MLYSAAMMMRALLCILIGVSALAAADAPPAATYKTEAQLFGALIAGAATPDMLTAAVSNGDHHRINIVRRTKAAGAVAHGGATELHHIIDGSGTLVTGGTMVRPAGGRGATIQNGVSRHVGKGDVILVPAGTPHWYTDLDGTITYLEVRWEER